MYIYGDANRFDYYYYYYYYIIIISIIIIITLINWHITLLLSVSLLLLFLIRYLANPHLILGHYRVGHLNHTLLITALCYQFSTRMLQGV